MWWDWHHYDSRYWHCDAAWPWSSDCYHLSCPLRRSLRSRHCWALPSVFDFDKYCTYSAHHWHQHWKSNALSTRDKPAWCHSTCLSDTVTIETGDESDTMGKGTFKVVLDVHHFHPDELSLKVRNQDTILLQGKLSDERAKKSLVCIASEFTRRYKLPRNYDATQATATLSADGILTVWVPAPPPLDDVEREVEIQQTGVYYGSEAKALEDGENEEGKKEAVKDAEETEGEEQLKTGKKEDAESTEQ